jgi:hypothetical protein
MDLTCGLPASLLEGDKVPNGTLAEASGTASIKATISTVVHRFQTISST